MGYLQEQYDTSERRACTVVQAQRSVVRYEGCKDDQAVLRTRIREIAAVRVRYGYKRIHVLLQREGWAVNHKRVYRLYCEEGLHLRRKRPRRHVSAAHRTPQDAATRPNDRWAMDFVSDALYNGQRVRAFTLVDQYTRECLAITVDQRFTGAQVTQVLTRVGLVRGTPERIACDNGPEFISKALDKWAYDHHVTLNFSRPGKPTDNAIIESFNGRFREECLNTHWFLSLEDAKTKIEAWRNHYNESRPHMALGYQTPKEFMDLHENQGQNPDYLTGTDSG